MKTRRNGSCPYLRVSLSQTFSQYSRLELGHLMVEMFATRNAAVRSWLKTDPREVSKGCPLLYCYAYETRRPHSACRNVRNIIGLLRIGDAEDAPAPRPHPDRLVLMAPVRRRDPRQRRNTPCSARYRPPASVHRAIYSSAIPRSGRNRTIRVPEALWSSSSIVPWPIGGLRLAPHPP